MLAIGVTVAPAGCVGTDEPVLTFSGSVVGREAEVIRRQLERFGRAHPSIDVALRATPDAADQRHQLYVQWLNARASDPDVLQLDVVWTPEFAAAGWIADLDRFRSAGRSTSSPPPSRPTAGTARCTRCRGSSTSACCTGEPIWCRAPRGTSAISCSWRGARSDEHGVPFGFVWQGARYEGLVTVFLEYLGAFGGAILDDQGRVVVDSDAAVKALTYMRDAIYVDGVVPPAVLTWQEEQTRFAFQNGQAAFMRNWPYAYALLQDRSQSSVAGRFAVAPMPAGAGRRADRGARRVGSWPSTRTAISRTPPTS